MQQSETCWVQGDRDMDWSRIKKCAHWDLVIAGGGITGAGVAREAARRGLKVLLVDRQDFSWGTSSRSSKMVHGGLRYIAQGDVRTTLHSVRERERLMHEAPGLVDLMGYMMPHYEGRFPGRWAFGLLLKVYDVLARRRYHQFHSAEAVADRYPFLSQHKLVGASEFADAVTDDSRLVLRVLHEARGDGAAVLNYVSVLSSQEGDDCVSVSLRNEVTGEVVEASATALVNATGVWVNELREQRGEQANVRPARGSHIVIDRSKLPTDVSFTILHPEDQRPIFVYPWEGRTVIGTTDLDHPRPNNSEVGITRRELDYLLHLAEFQFPQAQITESDVISSWAGVRPLVSGGASNSAKESRDHTVWRDDRLVSVSGGKLTTFRLIALDVLKKISDLLPAADIDKKARVFTNAEDVSAIDGVSASQMRRVTGYYGEYARDVLAIASDDPEALETVADTNVLWAELYWQAKSESVVHLDDLLLRRNRLGLLLRNGGLDYESEFKRRLQPILRWDDALWKSEVERYREIWQQFYSLPSPQSEYAASVSELDVECA